MTEPKEHLEEWRLLSAYYADEAKVKDDSDPLFYRHSCIDELLSIYGETNKQEQDFIQ